MNWTIQNKGYRIGKVVPDKQFPRIEIRHATEEDASLLARLGEDTFFDSFAADNSPEDMAAYVRSAFSPEKQAAELADPRSLFLIASVEGEVVGYARLYAGQPADGVRGERPIELVRFYSTLPWIGRGVGPALMAASLSEARELGYDTIWLGVWERNGRAIAFYRKWGFRVAGTQSFLLGADWQTDYVMVKDLGNSRYRNHQDSGVLSHRWKPSGRSNPITFKRRTSWISASRFLSPSRTKSGSLSW